MDFPVFDSVFIYLRRKNVLSEIFKKVFSCFLKFFKKSVDKCYENEYNNFCSREMWLINKEIEAWLSLVERCVRDAEVVGSNPVASTNYTPKILDFKGFLGFFHLFHFIPFCQKSCSTVLLSPYLLLN